MMQKHTHTTTFTADGLSLCGMLHMPNGPPRAAIIGCHGLMADKTSPKQIDLANRCCASGIAYFRFDHRGCGESEGDFETETTLENRVTDLLAAHQRVRRELGRPVPVGLFGSSLGGTVCLTAAERIMPYAIVTLAAPVRSQAISMPDDTPRALKDEIDQHRMQFDIAAILSGVHHILIIHGNMDETVSVENAHTIYSLSQDPKELMILAGGDHRITKRPQQDAYMHAALKWFRGCIS